MLLVLGLDEPMVYYNAYVTASEDTTTCSDPATAAPTCCSGSELILVQNSTEYVAYRVMPPEKGSFNLSVTFVASHASGNILANSSVYIQPWDSFPEPAVASSDSLPLITGAVMMAGIKSENYAVLTTGFYGAGQHNLVQSNVENAGQLLVNVLNLVSCS